MISRVLVLPKLRAYQLPVLCSQATDTVTLATVQVGKGFVAGCWLLSRAWENGRGLTWWWVGPTYEQAKHGFRFVGDMAESAGIAVKPATTQPPLYVELVNGSRIEARSYDQPATLMGTPVAGAVVDEFSDLGPDAYGALSSRRAATIARGLGKYMWIGNAGSDVGGPAEKLWRMAEAGKQGFAAFTWTWRDLAAAQPCRCRLPVELAYAYDHRADCARGAYLSYVERERERLSDSEWRRLFLAEWLDTTDLPVYVFNRKVHVRADVELQPGLPLILSCDFNVDPMAWVVLQHQRGEAWVVDEIMIPGGATTEAACRALMAKFPDRTRELIVYGDASGNTRKTSATATDYAIIRELLGAFYRRLEVRGRQANPPVLDRIAAVNGWLRSAAGKTRLVISPKCTQLARDLARVSWKSGTKEVDKSDRSLTHFSDAIGYAIAELNAPPAIVRGGAYDPKRTNINPAFRWVS